MKALEGGYLYEEFVEKGVGFINPSNVMHLCSELGLEPTTTSLMPDLEGNIIIFHLTIKLFFFQGLQFDNAENLFNF